MSRNQAIFRNLQQDSEKIFELAQTRFWNWLRRYLAGNVLFCCVNCSSLSLEQSCFRCLAVRGPSFFPLFVGLQFFLHFFYLYSLGWTLEYP